MLIQPGQPLPTHPTSWDTQSLTCKTHGTEQFLKLLELPWGQEQVQGA